MFFSGQNKPNIQRAPGIKKIEGPIFFFQSQILFF